MPMRMSLRSGSVRRQSSDADLPVDALVRPRYVAAAKPYSHDPVLNQDRRIADHLRIPRLVAGNHGRRLLPVHAVARPRQAHPPHLTSIATRVEHPIIAARCPDRGLAQAVLIERAIRAK